MKKNHKFSLTFFLGIILCLSISNVPFSKSINSNDLDVELSCFTPGVSKYVINQSLVVEILIDYRLTHYSQTPQSYYLKVPRYNDRQPNSWYSPNCPPYQESRLIFNYNSGFDSVITNSVDEFRNAFDSLNATLSYGKSVTFSQKYRIKLNEIFFEPISPTDIGNYDSTTDEYKLYTKSETFYETTNPTLIQKSNALVIPADIATVKAKKYYDWIAANLNYQVQDQERGALWAFQNLGGDCSDFSDLMITFLRIQGIPARKAGGMVVLSPTLKPQAGHTYQFKSTWSGSLQDSQSNLLGHAWVEYYVPNVGWISTDPTWGQAGNYFNKRDYTRITEEVGAWFKVPGLTSPDNRISEGGGPILVCSNFDHCSYEYYMTVAIIERNLIEDQQLRNAFYFTVGIISTIALTATIIIVYVKKKDEIKAKLKKSQRIEKLREKTWSMKNTASITLHKRKSQKAEKNFQKIMEKKKRKYG